MSYVREIVYIIWLFCVFVWFGSRVGLLSHFPPLRFFIYTNDIHFFKSKVNDWTLNVAQHSFSTQERMFLWKCQSFWDRKCLDLKGTRTPKLRIHAECSNHLSYQGQIFAVPCFLILALAEPIYIYIYIYIYKYIYISHIYMCLPDPVHRNAIISPSTSQRQMYTSSHWHVSLVSEDIREFVHI